MKKLKTPYMFNMLGTTTYLLVFALVLVGGLVRSTGAGMGCPDWPKCYGEVFPPSSESQLPANYKQIFEAKKAKKSEKFARVLSSIGMTSMSDKLSNHTFIVPKEGFNKVKAWTEYVNRLFGVLTGFFAILMLISSFQFRKKNKRAFRMTILGFVLILINGWLGSIVVASDLFTGLVTTHFILTFFASFALMLAVISAQEKALAVKKSVKPLLLILWFTMYLQLVFGSLIRETVDKLGIAASQIKSVVFQEFLVNNQLMLHKVIGGILFLGFGFLFYSYFQEKPSFIKNLITLGLITISLQIISGVLNLTTNFDAIPRTSHIFLSGALFGILSYINIHSFKKQKSII